MPARHMIIQTLCVFSLCAVAGCGGRSLYSGGDLNTVAGAPVYNITPGAGISSVMLGSEAGYFFTANTGGSFRAVWTGDANNSDTYRHFYGSVWTTGSFTSVTIGCSDGSCPLEADSHVSSVNVLPDGSRVDWDTYATNGLSGFDFVIDTAPAYFDLFIDDVRYPNLVYFPATDNGGAISPVAQIPFGLNPM